MFNIEEQLKMLPDKPGVYIMHDVDDKITPRVRGFGSSCRLHRFAKGSPFGGAGERT